MVFNATILIYENTHSKMTQMKNANITAAPQLLSLAELNFDYHNTMVKRRRQHYGQKEKTTLWSKEKDNTMVKRKRQHYGQKNNVVFFF
jgi:hypothetical protein